MKKSVLLLAFTSLLFPLFADRLQIKNVEYEIQGSGPKIFGKTQEYALTNEVQIDTKAIFENEDALKAYVENYKTELNNLRAFEKIEVSYNIENKEAEISESNPQTDDSIKYVTLTVSVKDSFHIFAIPGPKYDSNTGLTFKLKIKDSNFLGTLKMLSSDFYFMIPSFESDGSKTQLGFNCDADYPFKAGIFDAVWLNDLGLSYTFGNSMPEWKIHTGLRFTLPFEKSSLVFETNQKFINNFDYKEYDDNLYFVNDLKISYPIVITKLNYSGNVIYKPYTIASVNWDLDGISKSNPDLSSPNVTVGHELNFGRIDWSENMRTGFKFTLDNYFTYNFQRQKLYPVIEVKAKAFKRFSILQDSFFLKNIGISANLFTFAYLFDPKADSYINGDGKNIGEYLRGIRDTQNYNGTKISALKTTDAIILNLDLPMHLFTTNFQKSFLRYLNFEMQLSPFIDAALCYNKQTKTFFNPKDGFYAGGVEVIVYPLKWSGITIRGSIGIDLGRTFFSKNLNTQWRENVSKKEFSIGFGLHY